MSDTRRRRRDSASSAGGTTGKGRTSIRALYSRALSRGETLKDVEAALSQRGYHNAADSVFEMWEDSFYEAREQFDAYMSAQKDERRAMHNPEPGGSQ